MAPIGKPRRRFTVKPDEAPAPRPPLPEPVIEEPVTVPEPVPA